MRAQPLALALAPTLALQLRVCLHHDVLARARQHNSFGMVPGERRVVAHGDVGAALVVVGGVESCVVSIGVKMRTVRRCCLCVSIAAQERDAELDLDK